MPRAFASLTTVEKKALVAGYRDQKGRITTITATETGRILGVVSSYIFLAFANKYRTEATNGAYQENVQTARDVTELTMQIMLVPMEADCLQQQPKGLAFDPLEAAAIAPLIGFAQDIGVSFGVLQIESQMTRFLENREAEEAIVLWARALTAGVPVLRRTLKSQWAGVLRTKGWYYQLEAFKAARPSRVRFAQVIVAECIGLEIPLTHLEPSDVEVMIDHLGDDGKPLLEMAMKHAVAALRREYGADLMRCDDAIHKLFKINDVVCHKCVWYFERPHLAC